MTPVAFLYIAELPFSERASRAHEDCLSAEGVAGALRDSNAEVRKEVLALEEKLAAARDESERLKREFDFLLRTEQEALLKEHKTAEEKEKELQKLRESLAQTETVALSTASEKDQYIESVMRKSKLEQQQLQSENHRLNGVIASLETTMATANLETRQLQIQVLASPARFVSKLPSRNQVQRIPRLESRVHELEDMLAAKEAAMSDTERHGARALDQQRMSMSEKIAMLEVQIENAKVSLFPSACRANVFSKGGDCVDKTGSGSGAGVARQGGQGPTPE